MRKKVFVVDAYTLTRKGLRHLLEEHDGFVVCGEADGWREAIKGIRKLHPDIVVTELKLQDGSGWELIRRAATGEVEAPILVLTACDEKLFAVRLLKAGARGYLMKTASLPLVVESLQRIAAGHIAVSDSVCSEMVELVKHQNATANHANELDMLSDRELQVLGYLCQQKINKEIADCMGISEKTVSTYKSRLMEKIQVRTTAELLARIKTISAEQILQTPD